MHITNAIEKLKDRHALDAERDRLKISKASIARRAGKTAAAVTQFFQAKIDSDIIQTTVETMFKEKSRIFKKAE